MLTSETTSGKLLLGSLVITRGYERGTQYVAEEPCDEVITITEDMTSVSTIWHRRLDHMSEDMKILIFSGRIPNLKSVEAGYCEPCVLSKQKRLSFR